MSFHLKYIPVVGLLMSSLAWAQMPSSMQMPRAPMASPGRSGLSVSLMYTDFSDGEVTWTDKSEGEGNANLMDGPFNPKYGAAGLNVGYKSLTPYAFGYELGMNLLKPTKESNDDAVTGIYQAVGNVNYSFGSLMHMYLGANVAYFTKKYKGANITPRPGLQAGLGFQMDGFQWMIGLNTLSYRAKFDTAPYGKEETATANVTIGGVATQLGYMF